MFFIKLRHEVILSIFKNRFLQKTLLVIYVTQITLKHIIAELIFLNIHSFLITTVKCNRLDHTLRNSISYNIFKNSLLEIGRPMPKPTFNIHNPLRLKQLTRLRLGLNHLNQHRFNHNFEDCINPLCLYSLEVESTAQFSCTAIIL